MSTTDLFDWYMNRGIDFWENDWWFGGPWKQETSAGDTVYLRVY